MWPVVESHSVRQFACMGGWRLERHFCDRHSAVTVLYIDTYGEIISYISKVTEEVLNPLMLLFNCVSVCAEVDDLAVYLDQLLAVPQESPISATKGGLSRFRAAAKKTQEMVSLVHKARELNIHSEFRMGLLDIRFECSVQMLSNNSYI